MQWIIEHSTLLLSVLLTFVEIASAISQMIFPGNKGITGIFALIIKILQKAGAKGALDSEQKS